MEPMNSSYDYVIVGSGAAGSVLAHRLSEDPTVSALVLEAGGTDKALVHLVPKGFYFTMNDHKFAKLFETEPYGNGGHDTWHRGRIVGGSTTVNGMVWNRGWAPDYDAWEQAGNVGWNWNRFTEAYRAIEDHELGGNAVRGTGGRVRISVAKPPETVSEAMIRALASHGVVATDDMNSSDEQRVGYVTSNIRRGTRDSAARAFLHPAAKRPNVTLLDHTEVSRILFDGTRAVGVAASRSGREETFTARREVIVAGGSLESPLLLERSGIGDPAVLKAAGVDVLVSSPNVGGNLHEHRGILLQMKLKRAPGFNKKLSTTVRQMWTGFKFLFTRTGPISYGGYNLVAMYKSDPASTRPDTQTFFTPISTSGVNPTSGRMEVDKFPGGMFLTYPLHPTSTGSIHITGPGVGDAPRIIANFMQTDHDKQMMTKVFARARQILATAPFSDYVLDEVSPATQLPDPTDVDAVADYALNFGGTGYHTLGTCAIGPNDNDVVDARLRVRGTSNLRVVDASVFPSMPSGNNNAPTQAMAWIAADIILEDSTAAAPATSAAVG
jgi:choline dehydrogenase-like flavoprotein